MFWNWRIKIEKLFLGQKCNFWEIWGKTIILRKNWGKVDNCILKEEKWNFDKCRVKTFSKMVFREVGCKPLICGTCVCVYVLRSDEEGRVARLGCYPLSSAVGWLGWPMTGVIGVDSAVGRFIYVCWIWFTVGTDPRDELSWPRLSVGPVSGPSTWPGISDHWLWCLFRFSVCVDDCGFFEVTWISVRAWRT